MAGYQSTITFYIQFAAACKHAKIALIHYHEIDYSSKFKTP